MESEEYHYTGKLQDPVVKTLIIKAEGYLVLVPKGNMAALKRRLQEFGYLVV